MDPWNGWRFFSEHPTGCTMYSKSSPLTSNEIPEELTQHHLTFMDGSLNSLKIGNNGCSWLLMPWPSETVWDKKRKCQYIQTRKTEFSSSDLLTGSYHDIASLVNCFLKTQRLKHWKKMFKLPGEKKNMRLLEPPKFSQMKTQPTTAFFGVT